jgi:hypothetical protein
MKKISFYLINPYLYRITKSRLFGYFRFDYNEYDGTRIAGWGFNFILFGLNVSIEDK